VSSNLRPCLKLCEIGCKLSRLVDRQKAGVSCGVRVSATIEDAKLPTSGIVDGESVWNLDDPPRSWKAGHGSGSGVLPIFCGVADSLEVVSANRQERKSVVKFLFPCPLHTIASDSQPPITGSRVHSSSNSARHKD